MYVCMYVCMHVWLRWPLSEELRSFLEERIQYDRWVVRVHQGWPFWMNEWMNAWYSIATAVGVHAEALMIRFELL
jgi:hypothetical protein